MKHFLLLIVFISTGQIARATEPASLDNLPVCRIFEVSPAMGMHIKSYIGYIGSSKLTNVQTVGQGIHENRGYSSPRHYVEDALRSAEAQGACILDLSEISYRPDLAN